MAKGNKEKAKELYLQGMKLIDIAKKLDVPPGTVRRWKSVHKWDGERSDKVNVKSERSVSKSKVKSNKNNKAIEKEVEQVLENDDLTDKQKLFCLNYIKCFNATKAYQKAYGSSYSVANSEGYKLLVNPCIKEEIFKLKQSKLNKAMLEEEDIFQKYMDIAFADITDYLEFGNKEIEYTDKAGKERTAIVSYVDINDSNEVDGTIISEVSQGKDGVKVKLADRMKALQWLTDHMNIATEEQKARISVLNKQAQIGTVPDGQTGVILMPAVLDEPPEEEEGSDGGVNE